MIDLRYELQYRFQLALCGVAAVAFGCGFLNSAIKTIDSEYDITSSVRIVTSSLQVPKRGGTFRVGEPYVIAGRTYIPQVEPDYRAEGTASWYGDKFHGRLTANGEIFDTFALSAAHPTLPLPSYVRVTNLENSRSIIVRLNDRGPFHDNRLIDVSVKTAKLLGFYEQGLAKVRIDYVGPAELEGSDEKTLMATLREGDLPVAVAANSSPTEPRESEVPATVAAGSLPAQPSESEASVAMVAESMPEQPPEAEGPATVRAKFVRAQLNESKIPATVAIEPTPTRPRDGGRPVMTIAHSAPIQWRERDVPDWDIAEPVVALIPQSVTLLSNDNDLGTEVTGSMPGTVIIEQIPH